MSWDLKANSAKTDFLLSFHTQAGLLGAVAGYAEKGSLNLVNSLMINLSEFRVSSDPLHT